MTIFFKFPIILALAFVVINKTCFHLKTKLLTYFPFSTLAVSFVGCVKYKFGVYT